MPNYRSIAPSGRGEVALENDLRTTFYVDGTNGTAGSNAKSPHRATTTIDQAINLASAGDRIYVMPGHAETVSAATIIVPDTAGLEIIGLGRGARRPTLTFSATGSNIPISGAGTVLENFLMVTSGTINCTAGITVTGPDVRLEDLEFRESAADSQWVDGIVAAATSDRLHIKGLKYKNFLAGDAEASAISVTGAVADVLIEDFNIDGAYSAAGIENVTGVALDLMIRNGFIRQRHATTDAVLTLVATSTGTVERVNGRTATDDANGFNNAMVGAAAQFFVCWIVNADGESGGVFGTPSAAA